MLENRSTIDRKNESFLNLIGIQAGEGLAVGLLFGQSFLLGITLFALYTASNTIFLTHFEPSSIAYVYVVSGCLLIVLGMLFKKLEQLIPFSFLLLGVTGSLFLTLLFLQIGLWTISGGWVAFMLLVTLRLCWTLMNLVIWALAGRLFDLEQGKRLYPLIVIGTVFAIIIVGAVNRPLLSLIGVPNLLWISIVGLAGVYGLLIFTLHVFSDQAMHPQTLDRVSQKKLKSTTEQLRSPPIWRRLMLRERDPYIHWMIVFALLSTLATYLLEYIFVKEAGLYFKHSSAYASFFGTYLGLATLILLMVSLISGPVFARLGLRIGLQVNVIAVGVLATLFLISKLTIGDYPMIFWIVVLMKLSDDVLVVAMNNTAQRLLYQTLPADQQVSVQTVIESIVAPAAIAVIGLLLIAMQFIVDLTIDQLILILIGLCLGWLGASIKVHDNYLRTLRHIE